MVMPVTARSACVLGLVALLALSSAAIGQSGADISRGQEIANRVCSGCHGMDGRQGSTIQGVVVPSFTDIASRPGRTQEWLEALVMIPRHPMPGLPLPPEEVRDVVAYIRSLH